VTTSQIPSQQNLQALPPDLVERMVKDRKVRTAIVKQSHFFFFNFYFSHYVNYPTAPFHRDFFSLTEDENLKKVFIVAFRGSAKSSIFTMSYPLWAILGRQQKKFTLILCQTCAQAKQHMMNLKRELENNNLLRNDLGPFQEENDEWGSVSMVFSRHNARITAASSEQSIRGLRHNQYRPDLIIADDLEDMSSVKTREGRQKTYQWFTGEAIPAGDRNTRIIAVGNLLHEDSLLMRLKQDIEEGRVKGIFKSYPLINDKEEVLWTGKYPTAEDIIEEQQKVGNEIAWQREYLLHIVPDEDQVIYREWIQFYDELPNYKNYKKFTGIRVSIDPAISKRDTADYTAMVSGFLWGEGKETMIYILPQIINKRMNFPETIDMCKEMNERLKNYNGYPTFVIEDVAYQKALPDQLRKEGIGRIHTVCPGHQDKRSRLMITSHMIKNGKVLFPEKGCEELINQIVHFGVEKHDDMADAFANLVLNVMEKPIIIPKVYWL